MDTRYLDKIAGRKESLGVEPFCLACGYDMRGSDSGRCPECGSVFLDLEWRKEVKRILARIPVIDQTLLFVRWSWRVGLAGLALRVLAVLGFGGPTGVWMLRLATVVLGIVAMSMGAAVFRIERVPPWLLPRLQYKPDRVQGIAGMAVGGLSIMFGLLLV